MVNPRKYWSIDEVMQMVTETRHNALLDAEEAVMKVVREIDKDEMRWVFKGLRGER